jgi:hypothetical protein
MLLLHFFLVSIQVVQSTFTRLISQSYPGFLGSAIVMSRLSSDVNSNTASTPLHHRFITASSPLHHRSGSTASLPPAAQPIVSRIFHIGHMRYELMSSLNFS